MVVTVYNKLNYDRSIWVSINLWNSSSGNTDPFEIKAPDTNNPTRKEEWDRVDSRGFVLCIGNNGSKTDPSNQSFHVRPSDVITVENNIITRKRGNEIVDIGNLVEVYELAATPTQKLKK
ncbi:hypothetical protein CYY_003002 [Polysphondylium violaceum]|uniref:Uncharacterized protein n=1 Tax=Polysphondylium violaceum TaxID=133409 RepID=A0A8J4V938_9MYCE|nr:hypothetical protein CYY_003002 [Polysphondylium violaceum]